MRIPRPALFQARALHSGQGPVGVQLVEALSRLTGQDTGLGTLGQDLGGLLYSAGHAVDAGKVDGAVFHAVGDQVALLNEGDGTAGGSFRADMTDGCTAGGAGEAAVGDPGPQSR